MGTAPPQLEGSPSKKRRGSAPRFFFCAISYRSDGKSYSPAHESNSGKKTILPTYKARNGEFENRCDWRDMSRSTHPQSSSSYALWSEPALSTTDRGAFRP